MIRASASFLRTIKKEALDNYQKIEGNFSTAESLIPKREMEIIADDKLKSLFKKIYQNNFNDEYSKLKKQVNKSYIHKEIELPENEPSEEKLNKWIGFYLLMRSRIIQTTIKKLNKFFNKIEEKEEKKQVASRLAASSAFAVSRSDVIGRTEATILLNNSAVNAGQVLSENNADIITRKEWVSEFDDVVRPEHAELDGQLKGIDDFFQVAGMETQYPGGFGTAAMDCNCRCVTVISAERFYDDRPLDERTELSPRAGAEDQDQTLNPRNS